MRCLLNFCSFCMKTIFDFVIKRMPSSPRSPVLRDRELSPQNTHSNLKKLRSDGGFRQKTQDNHQDTINDDICEYSFQIPYLRKVVPYYYTYLTYCKLRWRDRTLFDIFSNEFRDRDDEYYRKSIENGEVLLNYKPADLQTIVKNGDLISHKIHRHEPPVSSNEIKIIYQNDELIVIDKPGGMPVHPTGRYRFNTVTKILKLEKGLEAHPCNRLDRLTSGLMFLARTPKGADRFVEKLKAHQVQKEYIARVRGVFHDEIIHVEQKLRTIEPRLGLNGVDDIDGKEAVTIFKKISTDGITSIVKCMPKTGRTHQIRVHLQWLGFPIANDPIYSDLDIWGADLGKEGAQIDFEEIKTKLNEIGKTKVASNWYSQVVEKADNSKGEQLLDKKCEVCDTELYSDPKPTDLQLWLHAFRYSSDEFSYQTDLPDWATADHIRYMELALEQANLCPETKTAFSVGALIVHNNKILSKGYSREIDGNTHAEQNAITKYFDNNPEKKKFPEGTVIYTTMEPCSLRLSGNKPCVDRILEYGIKTVFVGVVEPDTFVKDNDGLQKLREANVDYFKVGGNDLQKRILAAAFKGHGDK